MKKQLSPELEELLALEFDDTTPTGKITAAFKKFAGKRKQREKDERKLLPVTNAEFKALKKKFAFTASKAIALRSRLQRLGLTVLKLQPKKARPKKTIRRSNTTTGVKPKDTPIGYTTILNTKVEL